MGRISWPITDVYSLATNGAAPDEFPTSLRRAFAFDPTTGESIFICGYVPADARITDSTLKIRLPAGCSGTSAMTGWAVDVFTEFLTPDAGTPEALNTDANVDATADSGQVDFSTVAWGCETITVTLTPATTPAPGDLWRIKVTRDVADAGDDFAGDVLLDTDGIEVYEEV
jgi:hypothetical protein